MSIETKRRADLDRNEFPLARVQGFDPCEGLSAKRCVGVG